MHTNKINGKMYIGQTSQKDPKDRWKNGKAYTKSCPYIHHAIQKYGWENFETTIIEKGEFTRKEVNDKEDYWINYYGTRNKNKGYNIAPGGYKGLPPLALEKALDWMRNNPEFGLDRARDMHKWQEENPEEMLRLRRINSAKATEARKRKVQCIETGIIYESATEAARKVPKTSQGKICMVCRGQRNTSGGYHWCYIDE